MSGVVNERAREDRAARAGKIALAAKMKGRLVFDAALCVLLVFAMLRPVTGQVVHEVVGALLLVGMIAHIATSWGAASRTARHARETTGSQRARGLLVVMVVLGVAGVALALSALVISRLLLGAGSHLSDLDAGHLWSRVHIVSAYLLCIAVLAHFQLWPAGVRAFRLSRAGRIQFDGPERALFERPTGLHRCRRGQDGALLQSLELARRRESRVAHRCAR